MKQMICTILLLFVALSLTAQQNVPRYMLLKPYFTQFHSQTICVGLSNDSIMKSIVFHFSTGQADIDIKPILIPALVAVFNDSLFYVQQRTVSKNTSSKLDWGDSVMIPYYQWESYPSVKKRLKDVTKQIEEDRRNREQPLNMETNQMTWDESFVTTIDYLLQDFAQLSFNYSGYTGGAHPNYGNVSGLITLQSLLHNDLSDEGSFTSTTKVYDLISSISPVNLDSVKRVLYFKGVANCFDDGGDTDNADCNKFNVHQYDKYKIGEYPDAEYTVDYDYPNALIRRIAGGYDVYVEGYADASYAVSGDYSLTTSCRLGHLPLKYYPFTNPTLNLSLLQSIDKNIVDYYITADYSAMVLLRKVDQGMQLRCVYNEGNNFIDSLITDNMHVIQFQTLKNLLVPQLMSDIQQSEN